MFEKINITESLETAETWFKDYIWAPETLYQSVIILASLVIGAILYRFVRAGLVAKLDAHANVPATARRIAFSVIKLQYPLIALILMSITAQIVTTFGLLEKTELVLGVLKVLLAWIVSRLVVQFIANNAVRNVFALIIWGIAALSILGVLDDATGALDALAFTIGDFRLSALVVIKSLLMIFVLLYLAIFVSSFAERRIFQVKSLSRTSQVLIAKVTRVALIVSALFIGVTSAGIDLSLFAVFGGAIGLGIGFGLQKGISNLFSGMLLLMDRSIKPGDVIEIPDMQTFGWVNDMAARYTEIVTRDNKSVLIPNEEFITQRVINWSHGNSLIRVSVPFGVHYDSDMEKVIEISIDACKKPERVVDYREPVCWITEFGDSSVNFLLRFWIKDAEQGITNVKGEVYMELWKAFKENGIEIPYPQRVIHNADK